MLKKENLKCQAFRSDVICVGGELYYSTIFRVLLILKYPFSPYLSLTHTHTHTHSPPAVSVYHRGWSVIHANYNYIYYSWKTSLNLYTTHPQPRRHSQVYAQHYTHTKIHDIQQSELKQPEIATNLVPESEIRPNFHIFNDFYRKTTLVQSAVQWDIPAQNRRHSNLWGPFSASQLVLTVLMAYWPRFDAIRYQFPTRILYWSRQMYYTYVQWKPALRPPR